VQVSSRPLILSGSLLAAFKKAAISDADMGRAATEGAAGASAMLAFQCCISAVRVAGVQEIVMLVAVVMVLPFQLELGCRHPENSRRRGWATAPFGKSLWVCSGFLTKNGAAEGLASVLPSSRLGVWA